jgi:hypothetical protein
VGAAIEERGTTIEPTTVWLVHLDGRARDEVEGILAEDGGGLIFTEAGTGQVTRIAFAEVTKVKRVVASPVFMIRHGADRRETAFYLSSPPPLGTLGAKDRPGAMPPSASLRNRETGKWRQRRQNARYLAATSTHVREIRDAWVARIRAAVKEQGNR